MLFRQLGSTGLAVSAISFGAGPVSGLLTSMTAVETEQGVIARAIKQGINWFDTAATYGHGRSEANLGTVLAELGPDPPVHVATKVRVSLTTETDLRPLVVASVKGSLKRLKTGRITLLQIHNSITHHRHDQPTSITPEDVLGPKGLLAGMEEVRAAGWVDHFGLTGIGDAEALTTVMQSGRFATIQAPVHLLNLSALQTIPGIKTDQNYGGFLQTANQVGMGIFAIRVFAAGALLGNKPSEHTLQTPFFPIALYNQDQSHAEQLAKQLGSMTALREMALRYVLSKPPITSAIIGFGALAHVDEAIRIAELPELAQQEVDDLECRCQGISLLS